MADTHRYVYALNVTDCSCSKIGDKQQITRIGLKEGIATEIISLEPLNKRVEVPSRS